MTKSPQAQDMTASMGEEALMSFAEAMAQIVSSASADLTGSSVARGNDFLSGGFGTDEGFGGSGTDTCRSIEFAHSC